MPAMLVDAEGIDLPKYSVLGFMDDLSNSYMTHIAIIEERQRVAIGVVAKSTSVLPPLKRSEPRHDHTHCAWMDLSVLEEFRIEAWLVERDSEMARYSRGSQFSICPHASEGSDPTNKRHMKYKYSCVGFVLEALRAGTEATIVDTDALPMSDLRDIQLVFPDLADVLDSPDTRASLGIPHEGSYAVLLPGHLYHSLVRNDDEIRSTAYRPADSDKYCSIS